jgi:hypothetical protein
VSPPAGAGEGRDLLSAAVTMRVIAIGEIALIATPSGALRPSCHVSAATARLAQL